jgi:hydroxymethylpyrimidine/phosphomethylpyrimidine kinase
MNRIPGTHAAFLQQMHVADRQVALTIAGFDPSSGAGVTADLKVFSAHGIYGMAAITALTVQSSQGVRRSEPVEAGLLGQSLDCLRDDVNFAGIKIGMLGTAAAVEVVAGFLAGGGVALPSLGRVVLDPVLRSSSGRALLEEDGIVALRQCLLGRVGWVTPNREELETLTGSRAESREAVVAGARRLQAMAAEAGNPALNVVVTGGHLARPDDYLLTAAGEQHWLPGEHVATNATHGTGCAFSTALLCGLLAGYSPYDAAANAKAYVATALKAAYPVGQGKGPIHHLYRFDQGA